MVWRPGENHEPPKDPTHQQNCVFTPKNPTHEHKCIGTPVAINTWRVLFTLFLIIGGTVHLSPPRSPPVLSIRWLSALRGSIPPTPVLSVTLLLNIADVIPHSPSPVLRMHCSQFPLVNPSLFPVTLLPILGGVILLAPRPLSRVFVCVVVNHRGLTRPHPLF